MAGAVKRRQTAPSARAPRDAELLEEIGRLHRASHGLYGVRKVWWQLRREGIAVARCSVERLIRQGGLEIVACRRWPRVADLSATGGMTLTKAELDTFKPETVPNGRGGEWRAAAEGLHPVQTLNGLTV